MAEEFIESYSCDRDETFEDNVRFNAIDILANAHFLRLVDCNLINIENEATFDGIVTCDDFICNGTAVLKKRLISRNAVFSGSTEIFGKINSDIVNVGEALTANGKISAINVYVTGMLKLNDKLACDKLMISGSCEIKGKVNTLNFYIAYKGQTSKLVTLNAENVKIISNVEVPTTFALECDTLNCDNCDISYAKIDNIFCESAKIGPGCNIRVLECHEEPEISEGSVVEKIVRF